MKSEQTIFLQNHLIIFARVKIYQYKMFDNLSERLDSAFKLLKGEGRISEINVATTVKEIRRALGDADVNYKIAKEFTDKVKDKALGEKVLTAVSPGQLMVKIVKDELAELMAAGKDGEWFEQQLARVYRRNEAANAQP